MADLSPTTIARFWSKVDVGHESDCWPWRGAVGDQGYGRFKVEGRLELPHRVAYQIFHGDIPNREGYHGGVVMHRCDNPPCCNPQHLRTGSHQDNVADMVQKGRGNFRRGEGIHNSKLTADQVRAIRADPRTQRTIATAYGVTKSTIGQIKRRGSWKHV